MASLFLAYHVLSPTPCLGQSAKVLSVSPPSVMQGDTVLLTVVGKNLPTGTVVVEFFPQQIAVLNILSAKSNELILQVKIPNMAPPGKYNILIYNHLGEEAFGEGVLNVGGDLITPIFEEYDPKTISDASSGFAVMMTGTLITQEAVSQLEMVWYRGDEIVKGLTTQFAMAGASTVVCAITGELTGGVLRGRVLLNNSPIYMVEIELLLDAALIIGVTPSVIQVDQAPYQFKLLGMGITQAYTEGLNIGLKSAAVSADAQSIGFIGDASIQVVFPGPLPAGEYTLEVTYNGTPEYGGVITLEPATPTEEAVPESASAPPSLPGDLESGQPGPETTGPLEPPGTSFIEAPPTTATAVEEVLPVASIVSLASNILEPGNNPARLDIVCIEMESETFERLKPKLRVGLDLAELMLVSSRVGSFTYVFTPDDDGWAEGESGSLEISDPLGEVGSFKTFVSVSHPPGEVGPPYELHPKFSGDGWEVMSAAILSTFSVQQLVIKLVPPSAEFEIEDVVCSYTILPANPGIEDFFKGLKLVGELNLTINDDQTVNAVSLGKFAKGDLLVKITQGDGATWLATLPLDAPGLQAEVKLPRITQLVVDPISGAVDPAWLRWECKFPGLQPLDPEVLSFNTSVELQGAEVLKVITQDDAIVLDIEFTGLGAQLAKLDEISFWVDSKVLLNWDKMAKITVQILSESSQSKASPLVIQEEPVTLMPNGFQVKYKIDGEQPTGQFEGKVQASSSLLVLDWNLSGFEIHTEVISIPAGSVLLVKFIRNLNNLDDANYSNLCSELVLVGDVGLKLWWVDSAIGNSSIVTFQQ